MTYLADFYMGRIIKDTAALVEPSVLSTLHREFSLPGFTPALPCYCCTPQILCLLTACWHRGDLGEADCACSWVFQKEQLALEGPCLPLLVGLCESITVHSIRLNQISLVSSRTSGGQQKFGWLGFIREKLPVLSSSNSIVHRTSFKFQGKIRGFKGVSLNLLTSGTILATGRFEMSALVHSTFALDAGSGECVRNANFQRKWDRSNTDQGVNLLPRTTGNVNWLF